MTTEDANGHKVPLWTSFFRSQLASLVASAADILSLFLLTEFGGIHYLVSTALATAIGAVVGFLIGRYWAFQRTDKAFAWQATKYGLASFVILCCNVAGMYLLTDLCGVQYMVSKLIVSVLVGFFVSFPMFRYWVYR